MHIFIDESGGFQRNETSEHSISCVCAIIVPGRIVTDFEKGFARLSQSWPRDTSGEVKGRLLSEQHVADLCNFLHPLNIILEVAVMDMNLCKDADVDYHKERQAEGMTVHLTDEHHANLISSVWEMRQVLEQMPRQLYAQAVATTSVVWNAFQHGQLFFCQRWPGELGRYRWVIDAKDKNKITKYENWWQQSVMPLIQSHSIREPGIKLKGGDYSSYNRNFPPIRTPNYLLPHVEGENEKGDDLKAIFRELEFANSETQTGLQVVDILANALRRSLSGRMGRKGWCKMSSLTVHQKDGSVVLKNLGPSSGSVNTSYGAIINEINSGGRSMLVTRKKRRR